MATISIFRENDDDNALWSYRTGDIDRVAGILSCGIPIIYDINRKRRGNLDSDSNELIKFTELNNKDILVIDSDTDVSEYLLISDIEVDRLSFYPPTTIPPGKYGVWVRSGIPSTFSLYVFSKATFVQGMASIASWADTSLGSYLYGVPFDNKGTRYDIYGYGLKGGRFIEDAYDLNDAEEEAEDNENLIEPYRIDDFDEI